MNCGSHLVTLAEAAEGLGIDRKNPARWLKLAVLAREKRIGRRILVRTGGGTIRQHYMVNLTTLRRWYPDLFDQRDEVLRAAKALTRGTDAKLETIDDRLAQIEANTREIADHLRLRGLLRKASA